MRAIVAGSRYEAKVRFPLEVLFRVLDKLHKKHGITKIVSGTCKNSPDQDGEEWAMMHAIPIDPYPANWTKFGRGAGHIRNKEMALNADMLIAFWDGKSPGTQSMIKEAQMQNLSYVYVIHWNGTLETFHHTEEMT